MAIDEREVRRIAEVHEDKMFEELERSRPHDQAPSEIQRFLSKSGYDDLSEHWREWWSEGDEEWR